MAVIISTEVLRGAANLLYRYIERTHWNGSAVVGPDRGVRFNARLGRFLKSYSRFLSWKDRYIYLQAQGYWILDNWMMYDLTGSDEYRMVANQAAQYIADTQLPSGYWEYPDPEWRGRIATVEGNFAALGLAETYRRTGERRLMSAADRWFNYLLDTVGFQGKDGLLAVNYFGNFPAAMVPNNSTLTLWLLGKMHQASGDKRYLTPARGMADWLQKVQLPTGELPYSVDGEQAPGRDHLLCYQYNAFELLDLLEYQRLTGDASLQTLMQRLAGYLNGGIRPSGAARYDCSHDLPEIPYYTAAVAVALSQATAMGLGDYRENANRAFGWVLAHQRRDGGMQFFSRKSYRFLTDRRSYPRNLSMILYHLLLELRGKVGEADNGSAELALVTI